MSEPKMVLNVAAKAVIVNDEGKVLILREAETYPDGSHAGKYHLPGGRINNGEAFIDGLHREVREETNLEIEPTSPVHVDEWRPVIRGVTHQIVAVFMLCKAKTADMKLSEEHDSSAWINFDEIESYELLVEDARAIASAAKNSQ